MCVYTCRVYTSYLYDIQLDMLYFISNANLNSKNMQQKDHDSETADKKNNREKPEICQRNWNKTNSLIMTW